MGDGDRIEGFGYLSPCKFAGLFMFFHGANGRGTAQELQSFALNTPREHLSTTTSTQQQASARTT